METKWKGIKQQHTPVIFFTYAWIGYINSIAVEVLGGKS